MEGSISAPLAPRSADKPMLFADATEAEVAWVAGIYEGEGCVTIQPSSTYELFEQTYKVRLDIQMSDRDVLERIAKVAGYGNVSGPYKRERDGKVHRSMYCWGLYNWDHVEQFYWATAEWFGERRREQWDEVISYATPEHLRGRGALARAQTHCKRGHELTPENVYVDRRGFRQCRLCQHWRKYLANKVTQEAQHLRWHVGWEHPNCIFCGTAEGEPFVRRPWTPEMKANMKALKHEYYGTTPKPEVPLNHESSHKRWHVGRGIVHPNCVHCGTAQLDELENE